MDELGNGENHKMKIYFSRIFPVSAQYCRHDTALRWKSLKAAGEVQPDKQEGVFFPIVVDAF